MAPLSTDGDGVCVSLLFNKETLLPICVNERGSLSVYSFHEAMKQLSLASLVKVSSAPPPSLAPSLAPPTCLLDYPPLAVLTNAILTGLNEVRQCAPVAAGPELARETRRLLDSTVHDIAELHR